MVTLFDVSVEKGKNAAGVCGTSTAGVNSAVERRKRGSRGSRPEHTLSAVLPTTMVAPCAVFVVVVVVVRVVVTVVVVVVGQGVLILHSVDAECGA